MSAPEFFNPTSVAPPVGAYSQCAHIKSGSEIVYIAGQVGLRPDGTLPATISEQADQAFANILRVLTARGLTAANLAKVNIYVVAGQPMGPIREARIRHFGENKPASTLIYIPQLVEPKYLIEVEAVAAR